MRPLFLISRVLQLIPVLLGVAVFVFLLMHITPGDPVELMLGQAGHVTEEEVSALRHQYGLDRPIHVQFGAFLAKAVRGDLGMSFSHQQPVSTVIASRLPATIELTLISLILAIAIAVPIGIISAVRQYSAVDKVGTLGALVGVSMPGFWLGIVLIILFAVKLHWLPTSGRIDFGVGLEKTTGFYILDSVLTRNWAALWSSVRHLILPAITLSAAMCAVSMRMIRSGMLEVIRQDYILYARAKGLPESSVILKHALKNALIPAITVIAVQTGLLLSGNMIIETVFGWPGVGRLAVGAIEARNYPLIQGVVLFYAVSYAALNLLADLLYGLLNPKIQT